MARQLFTAADIRRLVREQKAAVLVMRPDDLVTPEAADVARELGVLIVRESAQNAAPAPGFHQPEQAEHRVGDDQVVGVQQSDTESASRPCRLPCWWR